MNPGDESAGQWKTARDRMLSYLDAVGVPPVEALEMTLHIIEQIRAGGPEAQETPPVERAVRALRRQLADQGRIAADIFTLKDSEDLFPPPTPELQPSRMVPQRLRPRRRGFFPAWLHKLINPTLRVFLLLILTA